MVIEHPTTRKVRCPECYSTCEWCSGYLRNARENGCQDIMAGKNCRKGREAKGQTCHTCDGSGVMLMDYELRKTHQDQ